MLGSLGVKVPVQSSQRFLEADCFRELSGRLCVVLDIAMLSSLRQDLTYAIRSFSKAPALTATIIVSIALGIAANTTVFSMVNELLIKDMPVRDPGRLFAMTLGRQPSTSVPEYIDYRDQTGQVFEGLAAHSLFPMAANLSAGGSAQRIWASISPFVLFHQ